MQKVRGSKDGANFLLEKGIFLRKTTCYVIEIT